jgi:flagellar basal-body rod protein FlgG
MLKALSIAATGMSAQQTNLEVISHNIANINTTGFKRARAEFADLFYQNTRAAGIPNAAGQASVPEGAYVGLGVRTAAVRNLHAQGGLESTSNKLDLAIQGRGWFQITGANGETLYTRAGTFNRNSEGQIVTIDGYALQPGIVVPPETTDVHINTSGEVFAHIEGQDEMQNLGQITLASFANDAGLEPLGDNLFKVTEASGQAVVSTPGSSGTGSIRQAYLESSNVDAVKEITDMISAQRAYEMNSKVIRAADEMSATITQGIR